MINLIATYYRNIWPFEQKECSLIFDQGKFLIKAPIGSGKSFLFFDGPSYALYKSSSRNMLNIHSKEGEISVIFQDESWYYLIRRVLKQGKSKDSCSSQFFSLSYEGEDIIKELRDIIGEKDIILWGKNIIQLVQNHPHLFRLEEIILKNETDIQQTLDQLLPPKPVFLSTMFLLQDAENIFEMQPAERLVVLKNVFWLLGIDEAKEQIQDKKREVSYRLKALQDQSHLDKKLRNHLELLSKHFHLGKMYSPISEILQGNEKFFEDIEWFVEQLSLHDFSLNWLEVWRFQEALEILKEKEKVIHGVQTSKELIEKQLLHLQQEEEKQQQLIKEGNEKKILLQKKLSELDPKTLEKLKQEKAALYQQMEVLEQQDYSVFSSFFLTDVFKQMIAGQSSPTNLKESYDCIQFLKGKGKDIQHEVEQIILQIKNIQLQQQHQEIHKTTQIQQLKDRSNLLHQQLTQAKERLAQFEKNVLGDSQFSCEKIGENCPFIKVINKQHFDQLEKQKQTILEEIRWIEEQIREGDFENTIKNIQEKKEENLALWELEQKKKHVEDLANALRIFLVEIGFKSWEDKYVLLENLQQQVKKKDQLIAQMEISLHNLQGFQQELIELEHSVENYQKRILELQQEQVEQKNLLTELQQQLQSEEYLQLSSTIISLQEALKQLEFLEQLIEEATATKHLIKDLKEKEKMLGNLYTILSKEMLLFALDEYLPVLSEIINSFLSQVVEYQISMKISETNDKLELEAKIFDEKGEREVKSLSWGQRTILKLVWMLAISSYLNTPLLFLDETINNLDADTIGKVSDMISNFVKQRTMKFYTVTHNDQIQAMDIWDQIIEI